MVASDVGEKGHHGHERKCGVQSAQEESRPGQPPGDQDEGPEAGYASAPEHHRDADARGDERDAGQMLLADGIQQFHDGSAEEVGGDAEQQEERDRGVATKNRAHEDVADNQIDGSGNRPPTTQHRQFVAHPQVREVGEG